MPHARDQVTLLLGAGSLVENAGKERDVIKHAALEAPWMCTVPHHSKRISHIRGVKQAAIVEAHVFAQSAGPREAVA